MIALSENAFAFRLKMASVFEIYMYSLNYWLMFERGPAMLVFPFDLDLKFKVKYKHKYGTWAKFNSNGSVWVCVVAALDGKVQHCQDGACDLEMR